MFLSSHNLPEVERSCDRVGIIREGRLVNISTVGELFGEHWRSVNVVLGTSAPSGTFELPNVRVLTASARDVHLMVRGDINPLFRRLATLQLEDVAIATPDIEDVFLRFYGGHENEDGQSAGPAATTAEAASGTESREVQR